MLHTRPIKNVVRSTKDMDATNVAGYDRTYHAPSKRQAADFLSHRVELLREFTSYEVLNGSIMLPRTGLSRSRSELTLSHLLLFKPDLVEKAHWPNNRQSLRMRHD